MDTYSIVLLPDCQSIESIRKTKEELAHLIGWYSSKNAMAHLTVQEFATDATGLERIKKQLQRSTQSIAAVEVCFDHLDTFAQYGTFYAAPNASSKISLSSISTQIQKEVPTKNTHSGSNPHITIARKLSAAQLQIAVDSLPSIALQFNCDTVALRVFDPHLRQFRIVETYPLLGITVQLSLF